MVSLDDALVKRAVVVCMSVTVLYVLIQYIVRSFVLFCIVYTLRDTYKHRKKIQKTCHHACRVARWIYKIQGGPSPSKGKRQKTNPEYTRLRLQYVEM